MNLSDPKFAAQVRKVTLIFSGITMAMSAAAAGLSLYTHIKVGEREHFGGEVREPN